MQKIRHRTGRHDLLSKGVICATRLNDFAGEVVWGGNGYYKIRNPWSRKTIHVRPIDIVKLPKCQLSAAIILGNFKCN